MEPGNTLIYDGRDCTVVAVEGPIVTATSELGTHTFRVRDFAADEATPGRFLSRNHAAKRLNKTMTVKSEPNTGEVSDV